MSNNSTCHWPLVAMDGSHYWFKSNEAFYYQVGDAEDLLAVNIQARFESNLMCTNRDIVSFCPFSVVCVEFGLFRPQTSDLCRQPAAGSRHVCFGTSGNLSAHFSDLFFPPVDQRGGWLIGLVCVKEARCLPRKVQDSKRINIYNILFPCILFQMLQKTSYAQSISCILHSSLSFCPTWNTFLDARNVHAPNIDHSVNKLTT